MNLRLLALCASLLLAACSSDSDDNDNHAGADPVTGDAPPSFSVDPTTLDVSDANICDITQQISCLYPFPNDFFTVPDDTSNTGLRVNLPQMGVPSNTRGVAVDVSEYNRNDGFSPGPLIVAYVPDLDLAASGAPSITDMARSLDADSPIQVIHAATGERQMVWAELDQYPAPDEPRALQIRAAKNFQDGERYIVVLQDLLDTDGNPIAADDAFVVYREAIPSEIPALESRRGAYERIFDDLDSHGIARDEGLYLSWAFTVASTENITGRLIHIRDTALADLAGNAPSVTIDSVEDIAGALPEGTDCSLSAPAPVADACSIFTEDELQGRRNYNARIIRGTFTAPNFLNTPDARPGSSFNYGNDESVDALPVQLGGDGTVEVPFVCGLSYRALEQSRASGTDTRAIVLGHGLFGNKDSILGLGLMAEEHDFMLCGVDTWGMSDADLPTTFGILGELGGFKALADRLQQGHLNAILLSEAILRDNGFAALPAFQDANGSPLYRAGQVYYDGLSQGAVLGGALTAVNPNFRRSVLNVAGMGFQLLMRRSNAWAAFSIGFDPAYEDPIQRPVLISLIQMLWDRGESNGYANHVTRDPLPGSTTSRVLIHVAVGDQTVNETAGETMARTMGVAIHQPAVVTGRHIAEEPYIGLEPIPAYPFPGSALVMWDSGPFPIAGRDGTPLQRADNLPQSEGFNTHGMPFEQASAREQKARFWRTGNVVDVCNGGPCLGDGYDGTPGEYTAP